MPHSRASGLTGILRLITVALAVCVSSYASAAEKSYAEQLEDEQEALREHCEGLLVARSNAASSSQWREVFVLAKLFSEVCKPVEDRFALSRAYEDMAVGSMMTGRLKEGLRYAQQCVEGNGLAAGCYARRAQLEWQLGKMKEARISVIRGMSAAERAVAATKSELANQRKPPPTAEQWRRNRYLRMREQLDNRLDTLVESQGLLSEMYNVIDSD